MMSAPISSPEKSNVKVTYTARHKRRRSSIGSIQNGVDESETSDDTADRPIKVVPAISPRSILAGRKSIESLTPKKVGVHLPGPSPKRPKTDGDGSKDSSARKTHRPLPSFFSLNASPRSASKPISVLGAKPKLPPSRRAADDDDAVSVAESALGGKRKTEEERRQFFADEPTCGEAEAHRAFCTKCEAWVPLSEKQAYVIGPWVKHAKRCGKETKGHRRTSSVAGTDDGEGASVVSTTHPRRTEAERKAYLEADPTVKEFGPHEVVCKTCDKTVKLGKAISYQLFNWIKHQERCSGAVPSSRVATAERKIRLVNDAQVKSFLVNAVDCKVCGESVKLEGDGDYNLAKWDEHKASCASPEAMDVDQPTTPTKPKTEAPRSSSSARSQPSVASAVTLVATEAQASPSRKRRLEEEGEADVPVAATETAAAAFMASPSKRARTDGYAAAEGDAPGLWHWMAMPWRSFLKGFAWGSGTAPPPSPPVTAA